LNSSAGAADGYRLTNAALSNLLAEYTIFWHYKGPCFDRAGWTRTPSESPASSAPVCAPAAPFPPSDAGAMAFSCAGGPALTSSNVITVGNTTTYTFNYADGTVVTQTIVVNPADGSKTITTCKNGTCETVHQDDPINPPERADRPRTGRISWQELRSQ
jgi:hypothetical protein